MKVLVHPRIPVDTQARDAEIQIQYARYNTLINSKDSDNYMKSIILISIIS